MTLRDKKISYQNLVTDGYKASDVKKAVKELKEEISKRRKHCKKHFNRYNKECIKARSEKNISQLGYSETQAIRMIRIDDELKDIEKIIDKIFRDLSK